MKLGWLTMAVAALTAGAIAISSCATSSELTRSKAKAIIESSKEFTELVPAELFLDFGDIERGRKLGYWREGRDAYYEGLQLTPTGQRLFTLSKDFSAAGERALITVAKTKRQVRGVTDITEVSGAPGKSVEFLWFWNLDGLPKEVREFVGAHVEPSFHTAILKRHPDGWRVEAFQPKFQSAEPSTEVIPR